ncbi:MAG TPA: TolC family protein [Methylotenera sp.]|nr:TolC family protein [Methylotenera sp.]
MYLPPLAKKPVYSCLLFGFLLLFVFSVKADVTKIEPSLTLAEAIRLATENQPLLQSLDDAAASSRQAAVAEGQLPDPKVKLGVINLPVTTNDALRYNRDDQTMVNVGYSQDVIPLKKREIASNRMSAEADQFQTEQQATARSIERDVALAWLDVFEAQRKSELYQHVIDDMKAERKVLAASVSSGAAKSSDVLRMDTEVSMTHEKLIFAKRDERKARAALSRWIGVAASRSIAAELPVMSNNFTRNEAQNAIEKHPMLKNAYQTEKVAQLEVDNAQASLERNWGWEVGYGKRFADRSDMLSFQVSIDLQLDRANRQDKRTAEKLLLVEKARKLTEDRRRELQAELQNAEADAEAAEAREKEHLTSLIPNAQARLSLAQAAYSAGKQSLNDVWQARRDVIEVELDHWIILTDRQRAAVKLAYLTNDNQLFKSN